MSVFKKKDVPQTPSPEEQLLSQVDTLGKSYEKLLPIYQQYEPQFLEQSLAMNKQFAPEFAQLSRQVNELANPEAFSALGQLSQALTNRGDLTSLNISPEIQKQLQQDVRAGQFARGTTLSPVSALTEAQATLGQRIAERDKWLNLATSLAGGAPSTQYSPVSSTGFGSMGTPQISSMTTLQQQANNLAFARYDREREESARRRQAITGAVQSAVAIAAAPFTGGASLMMLPGGINSISGGNSMNSMDLATSQQLYQSFA